MATVAERNAGFDAGKAEVLKFVGVLVPQFGIPALFEHMAEAVVVAKLNDKQNVPYILAVVDAVINAVDVVRVAATAGIINQADAARAFERSIIPQRNAGFDAGKAKVLALVKVLVPEEYQDKADALIEAPGNLPYILDVTDSIMAAVDAVRAKKQS